MRYCFCGYNKVVYSCLFFKYYDVNNLIVIFCLFLVLVIFKVNYVFFIYENSLFFDVFFKDVLFVIFVW